MRLAVEISMRGTREMRDQSVSESMNGSGALEGTYPALLMQHYIYQLCNKAKPQPNIQLHGASQYLIAMDGSP